MEVSATPGKFDIPCLPQSFTSSDRIEKLHLLFDSHKTVTVCAPAGYGKTTLAASYLLGRPGWSERVCWYRLENEDQNPSIFMSRLIDALLPENASDCAHIRKSIFDYIDIQTQPHLAAAVLCQEMWPLSSGEKGMQLVLDDFHKVLSNHDVCAITAYLIENLPVNCRLLILSRNRLNFIGEKLKLDKEILELNREDLRLGLEEVEKAFDGTKISKRDFASIIKTTEGWAAAITILSQALKHSQTSSLACLNQPKEALFRYLSAEVFCTVDEKSQDALAKLSLLREFNERDALALFGIEDTREIMSKGIASGMFIEKRGGDPAIYHFHSLFKEFLYEWLRDRVSPVELEQIYLQVSKFYLARREYAKAAEFLPLLLPELALELVMQESTKLLMLGTLESSDILFNTLSEQALWNNELALMVKGMISPYEKYAEMEAYLKRCIELSTTSGNAVTFIYAVVILLLYYQYTNSTVNTTHTLSLVPRPASQGEDDQIMPLIDLNRLMVKDRFDKVVKFNRGIDYRRLSQDVQWSYLIYLSTAYCCLGRLQDAQNCIEQALAVEIISHFDTPRAHVLVCLANVLLLRNDRTRLEEVVSELAKLGEKYDSAPILSQVKLMAAYSQYLACDLDAADEQLKYAAHYFEKYGDRVSASFSRLLNIFWKADSGESAPNLPGARDEYKLIKRLRPGRLVRESSEIMLAAIAWQSGEMGLAEDLFNRAFKSLEAKGAIQSRCSLFFHRARMYFRNGQLEKGRSDLHSAMELAQAGKYRMFREVSVPLMTEMMLWAVKYGYYPAHAEIVLNSYFNKNTTGYLIGIAKKADEKHFPVLARRALASCQREKVEYPNIVGARLFGKTAILVNGIAVDESEFKTKKVKGLLELLLLYDGRAVSKEVLTEILWPGIDRRSSMVSMRTALYQLRKTLGKHNIGTTGNNAFIYETLDGLRIRSQIVESDVKEFLSLHEQLSDLKNKEEKDYSSQGLVLLSRMTALYRAELMEGSDYGDILIAEREKYKGIFLHAVIMLGQLPESLLKRQEGEHILRRVLDIDPYNEEACSALLGILTNGGRRAEAVQYFKLFKKRFEQDLSIKVDPKLADLVKGI